MKTFIRDGFGRILRQERLRIPLTLEELSALSSISPSHLGRIERGERFPSASVLKRIAKPLGLEEDEIFVLAGYLASYMDSVSQPQAGYSDSRLGPYVSRTLSQEPIELQRAVIGLLAIIKSIAKTEPAAKTLKLLGFLFPVKQMGNRRVFSGVFPAFCVMPLYPFALLGFP